MYKTNKAIITCAVTGSIHTPSMSEYLPITQEEIAKASIEAANAGASVIHLHARNAETGEPSAKADDFKNFLGEIKSSCDAIVNITTGGSHTMSLDERMEAAKAYQPELCSLNMGPLIFDFSAAANRVKTWKFEWEKPYVTGSSDRVMYNTMHYIERICKEIGEEYGTRFEFECYDSGHLYTLAHFADLGLIKPPFFIQGIFGVLGGQGADLLNVAHFKSTADSLFGDNYILSVFGAGKNQMKFCTQSALLGGSARVGLEDSLYLEKGKLAESNAQQVSKLARILKELGVDIATPSETRELLSLKGSDNVNF